MIADRYEPLENGLARDVELGRVVRIRWIESKDEVDDPRLSHPNVVRVYDIREHDGRRFAAIEDVGSLTPLPLAGPLPQAKAAHLGVQAARALAAAHELGLVHAGEVLVRDDGVPKLSGFRPGEPGVDVRALAAALNEAAPSLPPLRATTAEELAAELEALRRPTVATLIRPAAAEPLRRSRRPFAALLVVVALFVVAVGLFAAFRHHRTHTPAQPAHVEPVRHGATAEQEARNLAMWLGRYSR